MRVITPGHRYELDDFESKDSCQVLQFIEKYPSTLDPTVLITAHDGTTNEEVLAVLINRLEFLNAKFPCRDNSIAITHLEDALMRLNKRTADRKARLVEGTNKV
jgi:hypothetical protein